MQQQQQCAVINELIDFLSPARFSSTDVNDMSSPMFYGNSYLHYTNSSIMKHIGASKMNLYIRFRAFAPDGILIWSGDEKKISGSSSSNNNDYMQVNLERGIIRYAYNLGSGEVVLTSNYSKVDDGVWHTLTM